MLRMVKELCSLRNLGNIFISILVVSIFVIENGEILSGAMDIKIVYQILFWESLKHQSISFLYISDGIFKQKKVCHQSPKPGGRRGIKAGSYYRYI